MMDVSWDYHPLGGIAFPTSVGRFVRTQVCQHDDWGHDISAGYSWPIDNPDTKLTFYVYPAKARTDAQHLEQLLRGMQHVYPGCRILDHSRVMVDALEGLGVDLLVPPDDTGDDLVASCVLLFKTDEWFIKVRATAATASPMRPCSEVAASLVHHLGMPDTRHRLQVALKTVVSNAEDSLQTLKQACRDAARADADPGGLMQRSLEYLERGEWLDAVERCMEMEEEGHPGSSHVESALHAYCPVDIAFTGGVGATLNTPVQISQARTDGEAVTACYRYLDCVLGTPDEGWAIDGCDVLLAGEALVDAIRVKSPTTEPVTLFFHVADVPPPHTSSEVTVLGRVAVDPSSRLPGWEVAAQQPEWPSALFLMSHLMNHSAHYLVRSDSGTR